MKAGSHLVEWIMDYLTDRPQYVCLGHCRSDTMIRSTGVPQGTVLSPVLFTLYTSDFQYNSCHMQMFTDDTAIVEEHSVEACGTTRTVSYLSQLQASS